MFSFFKRKALAPPTQIEVQVIEGFSSIDENYISAGSILSGTLSQDGESYICRLAKHPGYYLEIKEKNGRWVC